TASEKASCKRPRTVEFLEIQDDSQSSFVAKAAHGDRYQASCHRLLFATLQIQRKKEV
ncbi:hypothetical protein BaRGS_00020419, partial [Batillaria attramentaria]